MDLDKRGEESEAVTGKVDRENIPEKMQLRDQLRNIYFLMNCRSFATMPCS